MAVEEDKPRSGMRLSWDFNVGTLLTAAAMATGLTVWLVTGQNRSAETQRNLDQLQQTMTAQIAELRAATTGGLSDVRRQIESLPDERAQLADLQRRVGEMSQDGSAMRAALDARLSTVERATIELRADLNNIMRASSVPLPDRRR
jgi:hypothetical protein